MDELEALLGGMVGGCDTMKPIVAADLDKGFDPIADLKPGDKVRAKSKRYNTDTPTKGGAVITVHRVGSFLNYQRGKPVDANDFTALFDDGSDISAIIELAFDSRRFERITEEASAPTDETAKAE